MRLFALVLLVPSLAMAEEKIVPNQLTKLMITEGWITLFDGETTFGWTATKDIKVADGVITIPGDSSSKITWNHKTIPGLLTFREKINNEWKPNVKMINKRGESIEFNSTPGKPRLLRDIYFRPEGTKEIFNNKDLKGWKENTAKKASVFSVTTEGWLNVKNGPGDLQTETQYADFMLQFECISNGKHLNSGIFFRCIPGQYQQGYEAQIRNEWMGDDRTKPVDFGTGAIYRRVPARKVVSTDEEWFAMSILAQGKRISTWVNGYPVVDWLDERKESDNGRNGAKITKGAISIQGHDPTTNLSFRNMRIVSLDSK